VTTTWARLTDGSLSWPSTPVRAAIFGLVIAGILIGAALILVPMLIGIGAHSGTAPPPAAPGAAQPTA